MKPDLLDLETSVDMEGLACCPWPGSLPLLPALRPAFARLKK